MTTTNNTSNTRMHKKIQNLSVGNHVTIETSDNRIIKGYVFSVMLKEEMECIVLRGLNESLDYTFVNGKQIVKLDITRSIPEQKLVSQLNKLHPKPEEQLKQKELQAMKRMEQKYKNQPSEEGLAVFNILQKKNLHHW